MHHRRRQTEGAKDNSIVHIIRMQILYENNIRIAIVCARKYALRADWFIEVRARSVRDRRGLSLWPADLPLVITMNTTVCARHHHPAPLRLPTLSVRLIIHVRSKWQSDNRTAASPPPMRESARACAKRFGVRVRARAWRKASNAAPQTTRAPALGPRQRNDDHDDVGGGGISDRFRMRART